MLSSGLVRYGGGGYRRGYWAVYCTGHREVYGEEVVIFKGTNITCFSASHYISARVTGAVRPRPMQNKKNMFCHDCNETGLISPIIDISILSV